MFIFLAVLYLLPAILAILCGRKNWGGIFVLNLFLGWTFVFWVIALVWTCVDKSED